jgi:carboxymethylenebutenolidase
VISPPPTRRQVIGAAAGVGFALAVRPVSAATISTPADGLDAGDVTIKTSTGDIPGYRAVMAKRKKKAPIVLVVHEIFGVHEHIRDVCRRLAKQGYFAVAPELFFRQGDVSKIADFKDIRSKVVSKVPDAQVMGDLDATVAFAKASGAADVSRAAITGFCWGGRITWLYAAHATATAPAMAAGVAWYGRLTGDKTAMNPRQPIDVAAELKAPVLGLYGGRDDGIPQDTVTQMRTALAAGGAAAKRSDIKVYPDAGHAFFADYRPSYRADDAADAWTRMLTWFKTNGVG